MSKLEDDDSKIVELPENKVDNNEAAGVRPPPDQDALSGSVEASGVRPPPEAKVGSDERDSSGVRQPPDQNMHSDHREEFGVRPPPEVDSDSSQTKAHQQQDDSAVSVCPPADRSSQDITRDPYYMEPLGSNDSEANRWNEELKAIRDHLGGSRQALAETMDWKGSEDRIYGEIQQQPATEQVRARDAAGDRVQYDKALEWEQRSTTGTDKTNDATKPIDTNDSAAVAYKIANGHAFDKHKSEFPDVQTAEDLETITRDTIEHCDPKEIDDGRRAYWNDEHKAVVIMDPKHPDLGTVFKPKTGKKYYDAL